MKKMMLFVLLFGMTVSSTSIVQADTIPLTEENSQRASYIAFNFNSYPPKVYNGRVLVRVDKVKGGYVGWYV